MEQEVKSEPKKENKKRNTETSASTNKTADSGIKLSVFFQLSDKN